VYEKGKNEVRKVATIEASSFDWPLTKEEIEEYGRLEI